MDPAEIGRRCTQKSRSHRSAWSVPLCTKLSDEHNNVSPFQLLLFVPYHSESSYEAKRLPLESFPISGSHLQCYSLDWKKKKKKISAVPGTSWAEFDQHTDVEQMKCIMHVMHIDKWAELSSSPPAAISRARSMHNQNADRRRRLHRRRWNKSKINFGFFSSSRLTPSSWINPYKS